MSRGHTSQVMAGDHRAQTNLVEQQQNDTRLDQKEERRSLTCTFV